MSIERLARHIMYLNKPCDNCDDGCGRERYCDGCFMPICQRCWLEHNADAPDHTDGEQASLGSQVGA